MPTRNTLLPLLASRPLCGTFRFGHSKAVQHSNYLSASSRARRPSPIRALQPLTQLPGMISLGSGMPSPSTFPICDISFTLNDGKSVSLGPALTAEALQYSTTEGLPQLTRWIRDLQLREHGADDIGVCVGTGSQSVLHMAFNALLDRDAILLCDAYAYPGALESVRPMGAQVIGVPMDDDGLLPDALDQIVRSLASRGQKPRVLYTVPTGHNPCGSTMPNDRRRAVYHVCQQHDLLILEDDPYWFLRLDSESPALGAGGDSAGSDLCSFLSMDVQSADGCVLRFDSLSKVLSSGARVGWVSGPQALVERITLHQQVAALHPSGLSQAIVTALLAHWEASNGWDAHLESVRAFYRQRRDAMEASASRNLGGLARWKRPTAGMFYWFDLSPSGILDTERLVQRECRDAKVLLVPGVSFAVDAEAASPYLRAAFSTADEEAIEEGMRRLAHVLNNEGTPCAAPG